MKYRKYGILCERYGKTLHNLVWEYFLTTSDAAVGDMAREEKISRPKAYQVISEFMKKGYIVKSRIIGRTQLYKLNKENSIVKIFIRNFNECIQMVIDEHVPKRNSSGRIGISVSAKGK